MQTDIYTKAVLTVIAIMLCVLALKPFLQPQPAHAANKFVVVPVNNSRPGLQNGLDYCGSLETAIVTTTGDGGHGFLICSNVR